MKFFLGIILFILFNCNGFSQQLRIGVFRDYSIKRIVFSFNDGSYSIFADSTYYGSILPNEFVELELNADSVLLKKGVVPLGNFKQVYLIQNNYHSSLSITCKNPVVQSRKYKDNFEVSPRSNALTIVNLVDIDHYLGGVVESEGGGGRLEEYYKVQALISRTYALKNKDRHKSEGFDLCDRVHCQAYHNMLRFTKIIDSAVVKTKNLVLVDKDEKLIDSYFHANCGGQTCNPEYVWNNSVEYLSSFIDTFCIYTKQANWEKRISKEKWREFLITKYNYPVQDSVFESMIYTFDQPERVAFYLHPVFGIPLRDLRQEFNLKSTFFSCRPSEDDVIISGRGYGHGVGLCQEGAMKMSQYKYDFRQIVQYYFPKVRIVNVLEESFYQQQVATF